MLECSLFAIGHEFEGRKDSLKKQMPFCPMRTGCALYPMPQFGKCDDREFELLARQGDKPGIEVKETPFSLDNDIGIDQDCHLSTAGIRFLRASSMS